MSSENTHAQQRFDVLRQGMQEQLDALGARLDEAVRELFAQEAEALCAQVEQLGAQAIREFDDSMADIKRRRQRHVPEMLLEPAERSLAGSLQLTLATYRAMFEEFMARHQQYMR